MRHRVDGCIGRARGRGSHQRVMKLGDTVTWRARHFGIAFQMTSAITDYERPIRFVDEQQRGPFSAVVA
jgi:ligand-binding SRPBCC domain-containing protein